MHTLIMEHATEHGTRLPLIITCCLQDNLRLNLQSVVFLMLYNFWLNYCISCHYTVQEYHIFLREIISQRLISTQNHNKKIIPTYVYEYFIVNS